MSNDNIVIDDNTSAGDLRKAYEQMRARALTAEKTAGELQAKDRVTTVADLLKAKGVEGATKAANFYPADGEVDEKSVVAWIEENKDFLRVTDPKASASSTTSQSATSTTSTSPAAAGASATDTNSLAAQLVALATAAAGQDDSFGMSNPQGAPTIDVDQMTRITELMRSAPRTPEGYQQLVQAGIFPRNAGL